MISKWLCARYAVRLEEKRKEILGISKFVMIAIL